MITVKKFSDLVRERNIELSKAKEFRLVEKLLIIAKRVLIGNYYKMNLLISNEVIV